MNVIYCHHALRGFDSHTSQEDGITPLGKKDAETVSEIFEGMEARGAQIKAIYSSPFKRCMLTSQIISMKLNVPIFSEERFNEFNKETSVKDETWTHLQNRVRAAIKDIVFKYNDDDTVICVTSGVNIAAFISLAYNLKPNKRAPFIGVAGCSPIMFKINKENFKTD